MNQKGFVNILVAIGIIIVVGMAGYFVVNRRVIPSAPTSFTTPSPAATSTSKQTVPPTSTLVPVSKKIDISTWKIFKSSLHGYEIKYPPQWIANEGAGSERLSLYFHSDTGGGPEFEELVIKLQQNHDISQAVRYEIIQGVKYSFAPDLKPTMISGYPALIGEGFASIDNYGMLAYVQVGKDSYTFFKEKITSNGYKQVEYPLHTQVPIPSEEDKLLFNTLLANAKLTTIKQPAETAQAQDRDGKRASDLTRIKMTLALYFNLNNKYPVQLKDAESEFDIPKDPVSGRYYSYVRGPSKKEYHLGATLETSVSGLLNSDADFNSINAGWQGGFSGADIAKCRNEDSGVACYDIKVQ